MSTLAGSVTINPTTGAATGSGMALVLYNLLIGSPTYAGIVVNPSIGITTATIVKIRQEVAVMANTFAKISDGPRWTEVILVGVGAHSATPWDLVYASADTPTTITVPTPSSSNINTSIRVKKFNFSANAVTVVTAGGIAIDWNASIVVADLQCVEFTSSGGSWWITSK